MTEPNSHLTTVHTADAAEGEATTLAQSVATQHRGGILRPTRSLTALLGVAALGFGLAACGDTEDKEVVGAGSPTSSTSQTESSKSASEDTGEYQPATSEHPARNVPVPVMPEAAKEESFEVAKAFMRYWTDCMNYLVQTGDSSHIRNITNSDNEAHLGDYEIYSQTYRDKKWIEGRNWNISFLYTDPEDFTKFEGEYSTLIKINNTEGSVYSSGEKVEIIPELNFNNQPLVLHLSYNDGQWEFDSISAVENANYGLEK